MSSFIDLLLCCYMPALPPRSVARLTFLYKWEKTANGGSDLDTIASDHIKISDVCFVALIVERAYPKGG